MNTIIPLSGLVARLALSENLSEADASAFINAFFGIIEQSLAKGEAVTVKGLGTFNIVDGTVVYTPDEQMASTANAPFDMFSEMVISDDIDLSSIMDDDTPLPVPEPVIIVEPEPITEVPAPPAEPVVAPEPEPQPEPEPVPEPVILVEPKPAIEPEPEPQPEPKPQPEPEPDTEPEPQPQQVVYVEPEYRTNRCCIALWGILGLVVGLIIGISAGYVGRDKISILLGGTPTAATTDSVAVPADTVVTAQPVDTTAVVITEEDIAKLNDPTTDPENAPAEVAKTPSEPIYDTISHKRYLTTMAREHYGDQDYWVYIYQANAAKLRHPDRIKPGTKVLIPDFEEYRTSADPDENRRNARNLGAQIYAKYN